MRRISKIRLAALLAAAATSPAAAQTSLTGSSLALQSASPTLSSSGYVGTYLTVPAGGATVKFTINATASSGASQAPHMNLAVADTLAGFTVSNTSATNYTTPNITLPAGTHLIRNERDYAGNTAVTRSLTVNNLSVSTVSGSAATFANTSTDTNALAAANTYINNFRQGSATLSVKGPSNIPLLAGTPVTADLARHAFNFGGTVSGVSAGDPKSMVNVSNPAPGTEAYKFQQFINSHFNMIVPSNAGKWGSHEGTRDSVQMGYVDTILNYAQSHNMRARMHNHIWGTQQPSWVTNASNTGLLDQAVDTAVTQAQRDAAKAELRQEITERTQYYVNATRANQYAEIDIYNESSHTGSNNADPANYWNVYGASGIAGIYNEVQQAVTTANSSAKVYTNEYNVFQWGDAYANWYRQHIESIRNAGGAVTGIGFQSYSNPTDTGSLTIHSPARMQKQLAGLSVEGLPISLTEFGFSSSLTAAQADSLCPGVMDDTMRMMFGTPQATSFLIWGWWDLATNPTRAPAALLDNTNGNNTLTPLGVRWEQLMSEWDTNVTANLDSNGAMTFKGFYGDYTVGGQPFAMALTKGTTQYATSLIAPPTWSIWKHNISGGWSTASNWLSGGVADVAGQTAYFAPAASARTINVDSNRTVGMLAFDGVGSYRLAAAGGTVSLQGFSNANGHVAAIYVNAGSHTIDAPLALIDDTTITIAPAGGSLTINALQPSAADVTKSGAGTLLVNAVQAASLNIAGGKVQMLTRAGGGDTSKVGALGIAAGARLDLADNTLIIGAPAGTESGGVYDGVQGMVQSASNGAAWDGPGLTTSMPDAVAGLTSIGVATGAQIRGLGPTDTDIFAGVLITAASTIAMYTYAGDANLDGFISGDDYAAIDFAVAVPGADGWYNGDFNYDGIISGDDYAAIDFNIVAQGAPFSTSSHSRLTSVPEPVGATGALIALIATAGARRRLAARSAAHRSCGWLSLPATRSP